MLSEVAAFKFPNWCPKDEESVVPSDISQSGLDVLGRRAPKRAPSLEFTDICLVTCRLQVLEEDVEGCANVVTRDEDEDIIEVSPNPHCRCCCRVSGWSKNHRCYSCARLT